MIKKDQIEYVAKLARIKLTDQEKEGLQRDLSNVLNYVEKLQKLDTDNTELMSRSTKLKNLTREDLVEDFLEKDKIKDIFPEKEGDFLKVKSIKDQNN